MDFSPLVHARTSTRRFQPTLLDRGLVEEILALAQWAPSSCNLQQTTCIVVDDPALLQRLTKEADKKFSWAPCLIVLAYDPRLDRSRSAPVVSLGGLMQTILLAATERGLASCPMAGFKGDEAIKKILGIPSYMKLGLLVGLGYPVKATAEKDRARLPFSSFAQWNAYESSGALPTVSSHVDDWSMKDVRAYRERLAPVYLYNDHNRLSSFSESVIAALVARFESTIKKESKEILDICTYEGSALRLIWAKHPDWSYRFADHLPYVGEVHERFMLGARFLQMDNAHHLDLPDASVDVVTCFHRVEFTPHWEEIVREAFRVLRPGGQFFITTTNRSWTRRLLEFVHALAKGGESQKNVYDGNVYYKIGPYAWRAAAKIAKVCRDAGAEEVVSGTEVVAGGGMLSHRFYWALFKKGDSEM